MLSCESIGVETIGFTDGFEGNNNNIKIYSIFIILGLLRCETVELDGREVTDILSV